jgi:DNA helicase-2/ATP-dependent DNA helicase PcrA
MHLSDILKGLNPEQGKAVSHFTGPALVLAGAGSGKTKVLTHRIAHLIFQGVPPKHILALTFTNKAAKEMKERVNHMLSAVLDISGLKLTTFHAFGSYFLRKYAGYFGRKDGFTIYDTEDQLKLLKDVIARLNASAEKSQLSGILDKIQACKDVGKLPHELLFGSYQNEKMLDLQEISIAYELALKTANAFDFGDLILYPYLGLKHQPVILEEMRHRWQWVLVDEFQDTNTCQMEFLKQLCPPDRNLFVVGDDDQSIYAWRGANVSNMLDFHHSYPSTQLFKLEQNYRSNGHILNAANHVIQGNQSRHPKRLWTEKAPGQPLVLYPAYNDKDEAKYVIQEIQKYRSYNIAYHQMAILYRNNYLSLPFEEALKAANIPYDVIKGFKFYDRAEIKDAMAYLHLLINPNDDLSFRRALSTPTRGVGDVAMKQIFEERMKFGGHLFDAVHRCLVKGLVKGKAFIGLEQLRKQYLEGEYLSLETMKEQAESLFVESGLLSAFRIEDEENKHSENSKLANVMELLYRIGEYETQKREKGEESSWYDYLEQIKLISDSPNTENDANQKLSLSTIHSAKGLEFRVVFLVGLEDGIFPASPDRSDITEERRLFYVALTRAKEYLHLSFAERRFRFNRIEEGEESRFISEIPDASLQVLSRSPWNHQQNGYSFSQGNQAFYPNTNRNVYRVHQETKATYSTNPKPSFVKPSTSNQWKNPYQGSSQRQESQQTAPMRPSEPVNNPIKQAPAISNGIVKQGVLLNHLFYEIGGFVTHEELGKGKLQRVENQNGRQLGVVAFEDGIQKILLSFLTPVEG